MAEGDFPAVTDEMRRKLDERRQLFVTSVSYIADATERETHASGWSTKGKIAWLQSEVAQYRKDLHKILGD